MNTSTRLLVLLGGLGLVAFVWRHHQSEGRTPDQTRDMAGAEDESGTSTLEGAELLSLRRRLARLERDEARRSRAAEEAATPDRDAQARAIQRTASLAKLKAA